MERVEILRRGAVDDGAGGLTAVELELELEIVSRLMPVVEM